MIFLYFFFVVGFIVLVKKQFGQYFLIDCSYIDKIVLVVNFKDDDWLVEIGLGQGVIILLLLCCYLCLIVIEFDCDLIVLLIVVVVLLGELIIVYCDVLQVDFIELVDGGQICLVGNLFYNIFLFILFYVMEYVVVICDMYFMLQKEVVDCMVVEFGSKVYGWLSVMLQVWCRVILLFVVLLGVFWLLLKVDLVVVWLVLCDLVMVGIFDCKCFVDVVWVVFGQCCKILCNVFNNVVSVVQFEVVGVCSDVCVEQFEVVQFIVLVNVLYLDGDDVFQG